MATLDILSSTNFSSAALSDITDINFVAGANATARFASSQFNNVAILNNVAIAGSSFIDRIVISGGGVDASAWEFTGWTSTADSIFMTGSALADSFVASRQSDIINAGRGNDIIVSGHAFQGDTFNGERGNDTFRYLGFTTPVTDTIDGGSGNRDRLQIAGTGTSDFTLATISGVERLEFDSGGTSLGLFNSSAFGAGKISVVNGSVNNDTLWILSGTSFDLAASATFLNWTSSVDQILITGTAGDDTISGSAFRDTIESQGGQDVLRGRGGADTIVINASSVTSIAGGAGFDTVRVFSNDIFVKALQATDISSVEALAFDARGTEDNVTVSLGGHQIGQGGGTFGEVLGSIRQDGLIVFSSSENAFAVNLSTVTFTSWTAGLDGIVVTTNAAGDDVVLGADLATVYNLSAGADSVTGGFANDTFVTDVALTSGFNLDGEGGTDTLRISSAFSGIMNLVDGDVSDIEILDNEATSALIYIDGGRIGVPGTITTVDGGGDSAATALIIQGSLADLSDLTLLDWGNNDAINFQGTAAGDVLTGSSQADVFAGSAGADRLTGRGGIDWVNYQSSTVAVTVSLAAGSGVGGTADGDILTGIENVFGSGFGDTLPAMISPTTSSAKRERCPQWTVGCRYARRQWRQRHVPVLDRGLQPCRLRA